MNGYSENKICFITCVNDERLYSESLLYIKQLQIPRGMSVEFVAVRGASCMTDGYQKAMESTDAKYKVYMHQDIFIINRQILYKLLSIFRQDAGVGLIGLIGASDLKQDAPVWWHSRFKYGMIVNKQATEMADLDKYMIVQEDYTDMAALDGVFLMTQYDLPWRRDLFRHWHFYDISQTREFINAGYRTVLPRQAKPWLIHACGRRQPDQVYQKNMEIFKANYCW